MRNPKEAINEFFGRRTGQDKATYENENREQDKFDVESKNLAVPEVHSKDYDNKVADSESEQNNPKNKESIVFDTLAVPEIHIKKK